jgi:dihydroflavonol-4-reductase
VSLAVITGASGLLGANLAEILIAQGHRVRATKRATTKIDHLADLAIEWVDGDLDDVDALTRAFEGAEVVFHCAAAVSVQRDVSPELERTNVVGTANVIEAMRASKAKRLVHTSSVVALGLSDDGEPVDETVTWNFDRHGLADGYAITKHRAEELVRAATDLDTVIVNPAWMCGPRDVRPSSGKLIVSLARREVPGWTPGYNNFADVRDVARGMIAAWQRGRRGERYFLGGHEMTYRDFFRTVAKVVGVAPPRFYMPYFAARVVGRLGDRREAKGKPALANSTQVRYAYTSRFRFTAAKAQRELAYEIHPLEPAIADAVAWFRARGML